MKRPMVFTLLAALAATLASVVVYSALRKREAELQKAVANTVEIVVAARDLPLGTRIEPGAVKSVRWARDSLPPFAVRDPQTVINNIVKDAFMENEPIVTRKLFAGQKTAGILPLLIPRGMRALSVAVDEVSDVAGFILPHARVDILVSLSQSGGEKPFSKVVLQNVEVLAVAQEIEGKKDEPQVVKVVTVLVTPEDAERLTLAAHEGSLRMALRNYNDDKIVLTAGSDLQGMLHAYALASTIPVVAAQSAIARSRPSPSGHAEVEIMRDGRRRELVSFISGSLAARASPQAQAAPNAAVPAETSASGDGNKALNTGPPLPEHGAMKAPDEIRGASFASPREVNVP